MTSDYPPEILDLLALDLAPGLGPRLTAALLERFGTAAAIRRLSAAQLQTVPHIGAKLAQSLVESFARIMGLQAVLVGLGLPDDQIHAPNEKFALDMYFKGIRVLGRLWDELAVALRAS